MAQYVCLLLDPNCKVLSVEIIRAANDGMATLGAATRVQERRAWGYELWRHGRQVGALYDCKDPPARVSIS